MTKTYDFEYTLLSRIEADSIAEARRIADQLEKEVQAVLPTGVTLNQSARVERH